MGQKTTFSKPFLELRDLIALLRARGLDVDVSDADAEAYLSTVNYYRFTGYAVAFQSNREHFKKDARFSDIQAIYAYDRGLRELVFSAAEAVELTFRSILARSFTRKFGPLGYLDAANFPDPVAHAESVKWMQREFARSDELCARHFKANYNDPPLWALVEVVSFGSLVRFYKNFTKQDQNDISTFYTLRGDSLASYLHHISVIRNMCAHHARLYDHRFSYAFRPIREWKKLNVQDTSALFYQCALLYRLLKPTAASCFDRDAWKKTICDYLRKIPVCAASDPHYRAAIPADPFASPLWV